MSTVKRWYFGSYCGEVLALNRTDDQLISEDEPHDFVLGTDYDLLIGENEALRKDAERYRWLRARPSDIRGDRRNLAAGYDVVECGGYEAWMEVVTGLGLDEAIDEAMRKEVK